MSKAVVVAHPDDESLWFGGLVIAEPGDWTIICCSVPRRDPIRAGKFFDACLVLGGRPLLLPFTEPEPDLPLQHLGLLDLDGYAEIVTHNAVGEYGHVQHIALHRHLAERWPDRIVTGGYGLAAPLRKRVELSGVQFERKLAAIRCYDHTSPSDSKPKWQALLDRYGAQFDLSVETYAPARASTEGTTDVRGV